MTEERKRTNGSTGWLATLGGALLLVAVGFGVGLVAGTAYEEPELVAEHLAGRTTELALDPAEESLEAAADVAAAPPAVELEVEEAAPPEPPLGAGGLDATREEELARAEASPAATAARAPAAASASSGAPRNGSGYAIQVGAFGSEVSAQQLAEELVGRGYRTYVTSEGAGARFKVRVGPIASRGEAQQLAERLKREHRLPTWIMAAKG